MWMSLVSRTYMTAMVFGLILNGEIAYSQQSPVYIQPGEPFLKLTWDMNLWEVIDSLRTDNKSKKIIDKTNGIDYTSCKSLADIKSAIAKMGKSEYTKKHNKIDKPVYNNGFYVYATCDIDGIDCDISIYFERSVGLIVESKQKCLYSRDAEFYLPLFISVVKVEAKKEADARLLSSTYHRYMHNFNNLYPDHQSLSNDEFKKVRGQRLFEVYSPIIKPGDKKYNGRNANEIIKSLGQDALISHLVFHIEWDTDDTGFKKMKLNYEQRRRGNYEARMNKTYRDYLEK